jgi:predicted acetyltransferase
MPELTELTEPSQLSVRRADSADPVDRAALERMWLMFRHDMSEFAEQLPNPDGSFRSEWLRSALEDENWAAYLALVQDRPAGFAFVRALEQPRRVLNSFFIVRGARRHGYGTQFVTQVLAAHPGPWEIAFQERNVQGAKFWRRVATQVAGDAWREEVRPSMTGGTAPNVWVVIP